MVFIPPLKLGKDKRKGKTKGGGNNRMKETIAMK